MDDYGAILTVTLSIKSVPEPLAAQLRERAQRNHRSLQGELMAIIEAAATQSGEVQATATAQANATARGAIVGFDRRGHPIVRKGTRRIEDIAATLEARTPDAVRGLPSSAELIREMRDRR
jgi:plasmid stability protein